MLRFDTGIQVAWAFANAEASLAGSAEIEPLHFLLGVLKVIDGEFQQDAGRLELPPEALAELPRLAAEARARLDMDDDEIRAARRSLRSAMRAAGGGVPPAMLHRSSGSLALFSSAAVRAASAGAGEVRLVHLLDALLANLPPAAAPIVRRAATGHREPAGGTAAIASTSNTPVLDQIGRDVSALARAGRLDPVVGRDREIKQLARYLQRTSKANAIIVGEAGVGKTAIVEGLAQRLAAPHAPDFLRDTRIVQVDVADLIAGAKYRGDMEERAKLIVDEVTRDPNLILFLDEVHLVMKAGAGGDAPMDVANILKPALARGDFRCIGATTLEEYERHVKDDAAFTRRFQLLRLDEPSEEQAIPICAERARHIEELQDVEIDPDAVAAAVTLSARLIRGRALPDKAIDLLENAATFLKVSSLTFHDVPLTKARPRIGRAMIERVLEEQYGISVTAARAIAAAPARAALEAGLVGQRAAIDALVESIAAVEARPEGTARPLAVLLFTGPTGVGKSQAAACLAGLFGPGALERINMSELKERHELSRLIGSPPGFVGSERQGALFRFAEAHPQGVILLDEMEKAHPEIQDYFLQVFDQGEALDSRGRKADFRRHVFVMTCNVVAAARAAIGFGLPPEQREGGDAAELERELKRTFRPEFLGRVDRVVPFSELTPEDCEALFDRRLAALSAEIGGAPLVVDAEVRERICEVAAREGDGARGLIRTFDRILAAPARSWARERGTPAAIRVGWGDGAPVVSGDPA